MSPPADRMRHMGGRDPHGRQGPRAASLERAVFGSHRDGRKEAFHGWLQGLCPHTPPCFFLTTDQGLCLLPGACGAADGARPWSNKGGEIRGPLGLSQRFQSWTGAEDT